MTTADQDPLFDNSSQGPTSHDPVPERVLDLARDARRVAVLTGAGISAESGVPTYRDAETGLWAKYDAQTLSSLDSWYEDPELVWTFHAWQVARLREVEPNAGHRALAAWARRDGVRLDIATQNIDDLHERAGSDVLTHVHGSLTAFRCSVCGADWRGQIEAPDEFTERLAPPECAICGGPVRPGVVWFGEMLPEGAMESAAQACATADLVLVVGTSGVVYPFAGLPALARNAGVPVVEINPNPTALSDMVDEVWRAPAARALPALVAALDG